MEWLNTSSVPASIFEHHVKVLSRFPQANHSTDPSLHKTIVDPPHVAERQRVLQGNSDETFVP